MTDSISEREPEHADVPFDAPPGVHETEPDGDNAPAPDADTGGEPISDDDPIDYTGPGDLDNLPDDPRSFPKDAA